MTIDLAEDVLGELLLVAARERIALDEALGQANHADLEALGGLDRGGRAERDLGAATSDVDDHGTCAADVHSVDRGKVDQSGFLSTGDHLRTNAGFRFNPREKLAAVTRFARGAACAGAARILSTK